MADSLFDKILNGDISFTVAKDSDAQEQGTELPGVAKKAVGNPLGRRRGLGGVIGGGLRKAPPGMVYVDITGAIDGDEDGIVFEGTPYKRPIIPRAVIPKNVAQSQSADALQRAMDNESKRRGIDKPRGEMTDRDVADLYRSRSQPEFAGSRSRTDRYSIVERPLDDILTDLEMSQGEREVARDVLESSQDKLRELRELLADEDVPAFMHPGMTREEALAFIDSIKLSISSNGVPVITFDRLPYVKSILGDIDPIGDNRNWETVEALSIPQLRNLIQAVMSSPELDPEIVDSLDPDILDSLPESQAFAARDELTSEAIAKTRQSVADELGISNDAVRGISFYGIGLSQDAYIREKLGIRRVDFIGNGGGDVITELMSHMLDLGSMFDSFHDTMEHFGQGRGFDRHGEWVAFLAGMLHADAWIKREAERIGEESSAELDAVRKTLIQKYLFDQGLQQLLRQIETNKIQETINFARENYDNANREQRLTEAVTNLLKAYVDVVNSIRQGRGIQSGDLDFEELSKNNIIFETGDYGNIVKSIVDSIDNWRFSNLDNLPVGAIVEFLNFQANNLSGNIKKIREAMQNTEPVDLYREMFYNIFGRFGRPTFIDLAESFMPGFRPQKDVTTGLLDKAIERFPYSSLTADEIIELLDPRDSEGKPINGSKSVTRNATSFMNASTDDIQAIVDETTPHHIAGSKSRSERYPIGEMGPGGRERSLEDIAADLELTDTELAVAEEAIMLAIEEVQDILSNPDGQNFDPVIGKEQALDLLRSLTLSVSSNGIPMIIGKPHPIISQFIPSDREWDLIELPTPDGLQKIFDLLSVGLDKLESSSPSQRSQISDNILDIYQLVQKLNPRTNFSMRMSASLRRYNDLILEELARSAFESIKGISSDDAIDNLSLRDLGYDSGNWIESYVAGLRNMVTYLLGDNQDRTESDELELDWHDFFGHYGIGRAFDRHGEWANYLAIDSIIAADERFGEDRQLRNLLRLSAFFEYGWPLILTDSLDREIGGLGRDSVRAFGFRNFMQEIVNEFNMHPVRFRDIDADELIDLIDQDHKNRINSGSKSSTRTNEQNIDDIEQLDRITKAQLVDEFVRHENRKNGIPDRRNELISGSRSRTSGEYRMLNDVYKTINDMPSLKRELQKTKWKGKELTLEEIDNELANDFPDFSGAIIDIPNMAIFDFSSRRRMANRRMNFERAFIGPDVRFANIDLRGSNFENSFLSSPRFSDVDASETSFANAIGAIKAGNSNFSAADFTGFQNTRHDEGDSSSIFIDSDLSEVRFTNSNIHMSVIRPRSMQNAYFVGASLRYLNIDGSDPEKELTSMLSGDIAEPSFINFDESNIGILNIKGINLSGSSFRRAQTFHNISEITDFGDGDMVNRMAEALRDPSSMSISVDQMIDVDFSGAKLTFPRFGAASIDARTATFVNFENAVLARMNIGIRSTAISEDDFYKAYGDFVRGNDKEVFFRAMGPDSAGINISGARLYNVGFGDQTQSGERSRINSLAIDERTRVTMGTESIRAIIDLDFPDDEVDPPFVFAEFAEEDFDSPNGRLIAGRLKDSGARFISGSKSTTSGSGKEPGVWSPPEDPDFFNKIISDLYDRFSNREIEARQYGRVRTFTLDEILSDPLALTQSIDAYFNPPSGVIDLPEKEIDSLFERESLAVAFQSFINKLFEPLVENEQFQPMIDILTNYLIGKHGKAEAFKIIKKAAAKGDFAKTLAEQFMTDIAMEMISMRAGGQISLSDRENLRSQIDKYISKVGILSSWDKWFTPSGSKQVRRDAFRFQEVAKSIVAATEFEKKPARRPRIDEKLKVEIDDLLPDIKRLDADMTKEIRQERKIVELEKDFSDGEIALDAVLEAGSRILERVKLEIERRTSEIAGKELALLKDISDAKEKRYDNIKDTKAKLMEIGRQALLPTLRDIKGKLLKKNDPDRKILDDAALRIIDDIIKMVEFAKIQRHPNIGHELVFRAPKIKSIDVISDNVVQESISEVDFGELIYKLLQTLVPGLDERKRWQYRSDDVDFLGQIADEYVDVRTPSGVVINYAYEAALEKAVSDVVNVSELAHLLWLLRGGSEDDRRPSGPENEQLRKLIKDVNRSLRKPNSWTNREQYWFFTPPTVTGGVYHFTTPGFEFKIKEARQKFFEKGGTPFEIDEILEEIDKSFGLGIGIENLRKLKDDGNWDQIEDAIYKKHAQRIPNNRNTPKELIDRLNSVNAEMDKLNRGEEIEILEKGNLDERELIPAPVEFGILIDQSKIDASKKDLDSVLSILKQVLPPKIFEITQKSIVAHYKSDGKAYRSQQGTREGQSYSSGQLSIFTDNEYVSYILGEYIPSGRSSDADSPQNLPGSWPDVRPSGVSESLEDLRDAVVKALDESELSLYVKPKVAEMLTRRQIEILRARQLVESLKNQNKQNEHEALMDVLGSTREGFGYSPNSFQRYISNIHGREGHKHGDVRFWLESFRTIVPEEWIDALLKRKQSMKWLARGYFSDGGRQIALDRRGQTVLVHEIGHAIERAFPELIGFEALLFRYIAKKRGLSDDTVKTIKLPGDRERAWPLGLIPGLDESKGDYAAKVYGDHRAWELFTMIFQGLLADKNPLSAYDEDYVKWFLGVMATL